VHSGEPVEVELNETFTVEVCPVRFGDDGPDQVCVTGVDAETRTDTVTHLRPETAGELAAVLADAVAALTRDGGR
jgi:hypothetical protein